MKRTATTLFTVFMLISNESMHAMLCKLTPKAPISRSMVTHKPCHTATHNSNKSAREIKVSLYCHNRLQEIDANSPAFIRYLETKLQDPIIQQQFAGRPSLIIEEHKKNAPKIIEYHFQHYLDIYLPSIYHALDSQFEQRYKERETNCETKERIRHAFSSFNQQDTLQKHSKKANNKFKMHFINLDYKQHQKPITISIAANGDITIVSDTSQE